MLSFSLNLEESIFLHIRENLSKLEDLNTDTSHYFLLHLLHDINKITKKIHLPTKKKSKRLDNKSSSEILKQHFSNSFCDGDSCTIEI